jgi:multiple sugar transport system substrate-binding protein
VAIGSSRRRAADRGGPFHATGAWRLTAAVIALLLVIVACGPGAEGTPGAATPDPGTGTPAVGTPDPGTGTPDPGVGTPDPGAGTPDPGAGTPDPGAGTPDPGTGTPIEPPSEAVTLEFWNPFTGPDGQFMTQLVDQFNQEAENVQVNVTTQGEYYTVIRTAAEENSLPHVAVMHVDAIPAHAADGIIVPIDDLADQLGLAGEDFTPAVWDGGIWQDERYAIPLDIHTLTFYWNKALFEEAGLDPESPPTDQESFVNAARAITDNTNASGYVQIVTNNFLAGIVWATLFYQGGGELTNADGSEATYNSQAGIQAAEFMRSFIAEGISPDGMAGDDEIVAFQQGQSGMVFSGIWETTRYAEALGDDLGAGPVPNIFGEGVWAGSHQLVVPRAAADDPNMRQGAYYFIDWLSRHSFDWAAAGQIPARASAREDAAFQELEHISDIGQQADAARFPPAYPAISDLIFGANGAGEAALIVVTGGDAQQAFDQSAAQYTQFLQENKERYGY